MSAGRKRGRIGAIAGVVVILGAFTYMLTGGISENLVFFLTPDELLAKGDAIIDEPVKLGGQVVPGSVRWNAEALDLRFRMRDLDGEEIEVHARKAPPQMFREGMGVIVEGRLTRAGLFESTSLMVKHSNEYRVPDEGHDPKEAYKSLIRETTS